MAKPARRSKADIERELDALDAAIWPMVKAEDHDALPLTDFIVRVSPQHPPPKHFGPIVECLEAARTKTQKVCISVPPGHAKTTLILHAIAWWLEMYPADPCAYVSYNARQAMSKSVIARQLAMSAGVAISDETNNKAEWRTEHGGGLIASGIDGGLTGQRVKGLLIVDDPFKGPMDAYSQVYRDEVHEWFKTVALLRREEASTFVIHTRWHEDDLIGRLRKSGEWKIINLPAIANDNDPLGRQKGEALWPEMYPLEKLEEIRQEIGEFNFAALFQGEPRPRGGTVFGEPRYYDPQTTSFEGTTTVIAADPAASEKTSSDYSAAIVLSIRGAGKERVGYVRYVYRKQVQIPAFVADLLSIQQTWGNAPIHIESVGGFKAIPQMLRALGLERIHEIVPIGDKFTRAQPAAAAWNNPVGRILVPSDSPPWLGAFLDELAKFTGVNDAHDDQVDALSHGWNAEQQLSIYDVM